MTVRMSFSNKVHLKRKDVNSMDKEAYTEALLTVEVFEAIDIICTSTQKEEYETEIID